MDDVIPQKKTTSEGGVMHICTLLMSPMKTIYLQTPFLMALIATW
jgi:hypothetical protein